MDADFKKVFSSAELIRSSAPEYEFRTTVVPGLVELEDIEFIGKRLSGSKAYYLQQFVPHNTLSPEFMDLKPYPPETIDEFKKAAERYFLNVGVRGL